MAKGYVPLPVRPDADHSFIKKKEFNIPYASKYEAQKLDLYYPDEGEGPFPLIVYFHGGGFFMRDKSDDQCQAALDLTRYGYAAASCNYRLTVEAPFPAMIEDAKAATRFLRANAAKYNLDPNRFVVAGQSAGGYISGLLAATGGKHQLEDLSLGNPDVSDEFQACIEWFGCFDFSTAEVQLKENGLVGLNLSKPGEPTVNSRFFGMDENKVPKELMEKSNVINYVTQDMPPTLLQHGRIDHLVAWQQSQQLYNAIVEKCGKDRATFQIIEEADHDDRLFFKHENVLVLRDFLDKVFGITRS